MTSKLVTSEKGAAALMMLLAFMVMAVPLVTAALSFASTLSIDSRNKTLRLKSQYSSMSGTQHLMYRLEHEAGYADGLPLEVPQSYDVVINGKTVTVTVTKTNEPPPVDAVPPGITSRSFNITKTVTPNAVPLNTFTTYTYSAVIANMTEDEKTVTNLKDDFPTGLTYVTGSTSGITTTDPTIVSGDLRWNLSAAEGTIPAFTARVIQFQMEGTLPEGIYCNDIWVSPGGDKTRSGLTAKITSGSPAGIYCPGTAVGLAKTVSPMVVATNTPTTFTYTVTFTGEGDQASNVSKIIDLLPIDFSYVLGSTSGLTTDDPSIVSKNQGTQEELTWSANPITTIDPGETETLIFQATATLLDAGYYNELTATVSGLNYDLYTWPTAKIEAVGVFEAVGSDGESSNSTDIWLGENGANVNDWAVTTG